ncbi:MAG: hypothetical protein SGCHY_002216 [Lobulomycetales sp.]
MGGVKTRQECAEHYSRVYIASDDWPLPLDNLIPKDYDRQANRRSKRPPTATTVQSSPGKKNIVKIARPPSSGPANHEISGYMPARGEFDTEYENEAEISVREMVFDPVNDTPEEARLKSAVLSIYNKTLSRRLWRKQFIFARNLTDFKRIQTLEKKRAKESRPERDALAQTRPFARMLTQSDFTVFSDGICRQSALTARIQQLQEYRRMGLTRLSQVPGYEKDKRERAAHLRSLAPGRESYTSALGGRYSTTSPAAKEPKSKPLPAAAPTHPPASSAAKSPDGRRQPAPLNISGAEGHELLSASEADLCSKLRILPRAYLVIKDTLLGEYARRGGALKKRAARGLVGMQISDICTPQVSAGNSCAASPTRAVQHAPPSPTASPTPASESCQTGTAAADAQACTPVSPDDASLWAPVCTSISRGTRSRLWLGFHPSRREVGESLYACCSYCESVVPVSHGLDVLRRHVLDRCTRVSPAQRTFYALFAGGGGGCDGALDGGGVRYVPPPDGYVRPAPEAVPRRRRRRALRASPERKPRRRQRYRERRRRERAERKEEPVSGPPGFEEKGVWEEQVVSVENKRRRDPMEWVGFKSMVNRAARRWAGCSYCRAVLFVSDPVLLKKHVSGCTAMSELQRDAYYQLVEEKSRSLGVPSYYDKDAWSEVSDQERLDGWTGFKVCPTFKVCGVVIQQPYPQGKGPWAGCSQCHKVFKVKHTSQLCGHTSKCCGIGKDSLGASSSVKQTASAASPEHQESNDCDAESLVLDEMEDDENDAVLLDSEPEESFLKVDDAMILSSGSSYAPELDDLKDERGTDIVLDPFDIDVASVPPEYDTIMESTSRRSQVQLRGRATGSKKGDPSTESPRATGSQKGDPSTESPGSQVDGESLATSGPGQSLRNSETLMDNCTSLLQDSSMDKSVGSKPQGERDSKLLNQGPSVDSSGEELPALVEYSSANVLKDPHVEKKTLSSSSLNIEPLSVQPSDGKSTSISERQLKDNFLPWFFAKPTQEAQGTTALYSALKFQSISSRSAKRPPTFSSSVKVDSPRNLDWPGKVLSVIPGRPVEIVSTAPTASSIGSMAAYPARNSSNISSTASKFPLRIKQLLQTSGQAMGKPVTVTGNSSGQTIGKPVPGNSSGQKRDRPDSGNGLKAGEISLAAKENENIPCPPASRKRARPSRKAASYFQQPATLTGGQSSAEIFSPSQDVTLGWTFPEGRAISPNLVPLTEQRSPLQPLTIGDQPLLPDQWQTSPIQTLPVGRESAIEVLSAAVGPLPIGEQALAPQPVSVPSSNQAATTTRIIRMNRSIRTLPHAWEEYKYGINGRPSIESLDAETKNKWRKYTSAKDTNTESKYYGRRMKLIRAIQRMAEEENISEETAVARFEEKRGTGTLDKLQKSL